MWSRKICARKTGRVSDESANVPGAESCWRGVRQEGSKQEAFQNSRWEPVPAAHAARGSVGRTGHRRVPRPRPAWPHPASPPPPSCAGIARQLGGDLAASVLLVCAALKAAAVGAVALGLGASRWSLLLPNGWEPFCSPPQPAVSRSGSRRGAGAALGCSVSGRPRLCSALGAGGGVLRIFSVQQGALCPRGAEPRGGASSRSLSARCWGPLPSRVGGMDHGQSAGGGAGLWVGGWVLSSPLSPGVGGAQPRAARPCGLTPGPVGGPQPHYPPA